MKKNLHKEGFITQSSGVCGPPPGEAPRHWSIQQVFLKTRSFFISYDFWQRNKSENAQIQTKSSPLSNALNAMKLNTWMPRYSFNAKIDQATSKFKIYYGGEVWL